MLGILLLLGMRVLHPIFVQSPTYDEATKIATSYAFDSTRDPKYDPINPPVAKIFHALPLLLMKPVLPVPTPEQRLGDSNHFKLEYEFFFGGRFMFHNRVPAARMYISARLVSFVFYLLGGIFVFFFLRRAAGDAAAALGGLLYFLCPNIAAAACIPNNDILAVFSTILFAASFMRFVSRQTALNAALLGAALGFAIGSKISLLVFLPLPLAALVLLHIRETISTRALVILSAAFGAALFLTIEACYLFMSPRLILQTVMDAVSFVDNGRMAYFFGQHSLKGFLLFFPAGFFLKTPLPIIALTIGAVYLFVREKKYADTRLLALTACMVLFAAEVIASRLNLGYRYFLPVHAMLYLFIPLVMAAHRGLLKRVIAPACALLLVSNALAHPHYQSYFNLLIGSNTNASRYYVDSTVDWGQDMYGLARYLRREGNPELVLSYFGTCEPAYYGLTFQNLTSNGLDQAMIDGLNDHINSDAPAKEFLAVSATCLRGLDFPDSDRFAFLHDREPEKIIGNSIFVYDITRAPSVHTNMGAVYLKTGQLAHMLHSGRRVHALAPEDAFGIVCAAVSVFAKNPKETEHALTTLSPTAGADRLYAETALAFGASLIREKKFDAAMKYLDVIQRSEAFRDMRYRIHNLRGSVFLRRNNLSSAGAEFLQSIAARQDYPIAHYNLGIVLEKTGYTADAVASYRRASPSTPATETPPSA